MTTLVVIVFLSSVFGGTIRATLIFEDMASCLQFKHNLQKFTIRHTIMQDCR